jgi:hypothetical protein
MLLATNRDKATPRQVQDAGLDAVLKAIESGKKGIKSKNQLALALGIRRQAITGWSEVPVKHVLEIERLLGVPRYVQRVDIYPRPARLKPKK